MWREHIDGLTQCLEAGMYSSWKSKVKKTIKDTADFSKSLQYCACRRGYQMFSPPFLELT